MRNRSHLQSASRRRHPDLRRRSGSFVHYFLCLSIAPCRTFISICDFLQLIDNPFRLFPVVDSTHAKCAHASYLLSSLYTHANAHMHRMCDSARVVDRSKRSLSCSPRRAETHPQSTPTRTRRAFFTFRLAIVVYSDRNRPFLRRACLC